MSKDAIAGIYTQLLVDDDYRESLSANPGLLDDYDLTDEEKGVLREEVGAEVEGFAIGAGPVMSYMSARRGPPLSPSIASGLGAALNAAAGLPVGALNGPGFVSNTGCCPWGGHGAVPNFGAIE